MADRPLYTNVYQSDPVLRGIDTSKWGRLQSYSTVWTATAGTAPAIGDGTLTSAYSLLGPDVYSVIITLTGGAGTTWGNGGRWNFTIPFAAGRTCTGSAYILDSGTAVYVGIPLITAGGTNMLISLDNSANNVTFNAPMTWTTGDTMILNAMVYTR
jgi:hypothetical protein